MADSLDAAVDPARKPTASAARQTVLRRTCACGQHRMAGVGDCESCRRRSAPDGSGPGAELFRSSEGAGSVPRTGYRTVGAGSARRVFPGLDVSTPGDPFEREADRAADEVLRVPDPVVDRGRAPAAAGDHRGVRREVEPDGDDRKVDSGDDVADRLDRRRGAGEPLAPAVRSYFEPRFGRSLGDVRVHTDPEAGRLAHRLAALAFTRGTDVYFAPGRYAPDTTSGRRLLAHELAHTLQPADEASSVLGRVRRQAATPPESPVDVPDRPASDAPVVPAGAPEAGPEPEHRQFVELRAPETVQEVPAASVPSAAPPGGVAEQEKEIAEGRAELETVAAKLREAGAEVAEEPPQTGEEAGAGEVPAGAEPGAPGTVEGALDAAAAQAPALLGGAAAEVAALAAGGVSFAARPVESSSDVPAALDARRQRTGAEALGRRFVARNAFLAQSLVDVALTAAPSAAATAASAKAAIAAAVAANDATVRTHIEAQRARARDEAATAIARITAGRTDTIATIKEAVESGLGAIDRHHTAMQQTLLTAEQDKVEAVDTLYGTWVGNFRAVGTEVGAEAKSMGRARADEWLAQRNGESSVLDGPIHDNRLEARADAAVKVSEAYDGGLRAEADKQADAVLAGKPAVLGEVTRAASEVRKVVTDHHREIRDTMIAARDRAVAQADDTATRLVKGVRSALRGTLGVLDEREKQQTARLAVYGQRQQNAVDRDAGAAVAAVVSGAVAAAGGFSESLRGFVGAAATTAAPEPAHVAQLLGETQLQVDVTAAMLLQQVSAAIQASVSGVDVGGTQAVAGLDEIGANATVEATATVDGLSESIRLARQQATAGFTQLRTGQKSFVARSEKAATGGFDQAKRELTETFGAVGTQAEKSFVDTRGELRKGLRDSFPAMRQEIETQAQKAADAVQPRWKKWLKVALVIAVVVAAAALTILTAGSLGPIATIAVGAAIGAVAGGAIQVGSNLIDGKEWSDGVVKAMVVGGIGGAFGGLGGVLAKGVGSAALKIGVEVGVDAVGGVVGDLAVGNQITVAGVLLGAAIGSAIGAGIGGLGALKNLRNKIKLPPAGAPVPPTGRPRAATPTADVPTGAPRPAPPRAPTEPPALPGRPPAAPPGAAKSQSPDRQHEAPESARQGLVEEPGPPAGPGRATEAATPARVGETQHELKVRDGPDGPEVWACSAVCGPLKAKVDELLQHVQDSEARRRLNQLRVEADALEVRMRNGEIPEAADRLSALRSLGDRLRVIGDADPRIGPLLDAGPDFSRLGITVGEPRIIRPDGVDSLNLPPDSKVLYIVRDQDGNVLKVGETTAGEPLEARFDRYARAGSRLNLELKIEVRPVTVPEGQGIRAFEQSLRDQVDWGASGRLPWDNTVLDGLGPRLGRPGPGTPFEPLPGGSPLRKQGWYWNERGELVPPGGGPAPSFRRSNAPPPADAVRSRIAAAEGDVEAAAEAAGVSTRTFYDWLRRYGIRPADFRLAR